MFSNCIERLGHTNKKQQQQQQQQQTNKQRKTKEKINK